MDSKKLNMILTILKVGLVALGVIAFLLILVNSPSSDELAEIEGFRDGGSMGFAVSYTGFILFAGIGLILVFFVQSLISNTKKTIKSIIGLIAALVVFLILYLMGTSDTNEMLAIKEEQYVSDGTLAQITAGLYTVLLGVIVGFLLAIFGPFMGKYRK